MGEGAGQRRFAGRIGPAIDVAELPPARARPERAGAGGGQVGGRAVAAVEVVLDERVGSVVGSVAPDVEQPLVGVDALEFHVCSSTTRL